MKKLVLILIVALAPAFVIAQNSAVEKLFKKYGGQDGFTTITVNSGLLRLAADFTDEEEGLEVLNSIKSIKILAQEDGEADNFYNEVKSLLSNNDYEELMTVNSNDEDVVFLIKKEGKKISEFLLVVGGDDENVVIYIEGSLDMKEIAHLGKSINIKGDTFEHLSELEKLDK